MIYVLFSLGYYLLFPYPLAWSRFMATTPGQYELALMFSVPLLEHRAVVADYRVNGWSYTRFDRVGVRQRWEDARQGQSSTLMARRSSMAR